MTFRFRFGAAIGLSALLLSPLGASTAPDRQKPAYGKGNWNAESLGNHRAVVRVDMAADAVAVRIPWRRRDENPDKKALIIMDDVTGGRIRNLRRLEINREFGDLVFQPVSGPGIYYVYYMPNVMSGRRNYPTVSYPEPENTSEREWLERHGLTPDALTHKRNRDFPGAKVEYIQAIDDFHSFSPMEIIPTADEIEHLLETHPDSGYLLFPEERRFPVRMRRDIPLRWIERGPGGVLNLEADRGEYLAFQIGVFACRANIPDLTVDFFPLRSEHPGNEEFANSFTCFNTGGIDWKGNPFIKSCPVPAGTVQSLWCGTGIPRDLEPGIYRVRVRVSPAGLPAGQVDLAISVSPEILSDSGDSEPWRHSRLRWLNSTLALDDGVVAPYHTLRVENSRVDILGRSLTIGDFGLPEAISSRFSPEMTSIGREQRPLLADPIRLVVLNEAGNPLPWRTGGVHPGKKTEGSYEWKFSADSGPVELSGRGRMEFDGYVEFQIELTVSDDIELKDIFLDIPMRKETARLMMGMGVKGGYRPKTFSWKWDSRLNQDSVWLGDVNAGLQCGFRDDGYSRPLNTNFYLLKPLVLPESWCNSGRGGCEINEIGDTVLIRAAGGPRRMKSGDRLRFDFTLLITPFRTIDPGRQWATRYYHRFEPLDKIASAGANTINVHHATDINPFINYPFLRPGAMRTYVDKAHERGMKVKIYYTVRELSNRAPELFALFSLGEEIFFPGEGGGFSWLQEHLNGDYIAAWFVPDLQDAAVINSGTSRWHNYYVEGLNWLTRNIGIDGLYIDDVAFDRTTMKRVRRILDRNRPGAMIDLHSANQFNVRDGFANSANLYLEHFPYLDRLWFGEYFDYDAPPEYWLVEISGIPFGLMGEMLQDGGNPWRGMLFGMTSRLPWAGDPSPLWKLWDEFGIQNTRMIGFWVKDRPVKSGRADVPVTTYVGDRRALVAVAGWASEDTDASLSFDWKALGIAANRAILTAPAVKDFQPAAEFRPQDRIPIARGKGWLLILHETERSGPPDTAPGDK